MPKPWNDLGRYGGIGIELVLAIVLLAGFGHWVDGRFWPGKGWAMTIGFFLGAAVGVRGLVRAAQRMQGDIERAEAHDPEAKNWKVDESWLHEDARDTVRRGGPSEPSAPENGNGAAH